MNKKSKKVSVIIPTYKRASMLERAIESVLNQTYNNIEIIIVDDNNQDSEYRIENEKKMFKYNSNNKVIYLKHEFNKNGAAARNTGIKKATGDYITFLDDDDFFLPTRIEKLVNLMEENEVYGGAYSSAAIMTDKKITKLIKAERNGNLKLEMLKTQSFFGTGSNMFFRAEVIKKIGFFDEAFIRFQDLEYMTRFFDENKIINLKEILVVKCNDDRGNIPSYKKLLEAKRIFLNKFRNDITKYKNISNDIYYENYIGLLYYFMNDKEAYNVILEKLENYRKIKFKDKLKIFIIKHSKKIPFIYKIKLLIKQQKINKELSQDLKEAIYKVLG